MTIAVDLGRKATKQTKQNFISEIQNLSAGLLTDVLFLPQYYKLPNSGTSCKGLEKSLNSFSVGINTVDRDLNQNKSVVPLFGAANAAANAGPNKGTTILYKFSSTNFSMISV